MASLTPQTEKPFHYSYLKEFRVNQCPLFLQHKCTQHRPFTCFNWHFSNQRRRRPLRKRDGNFNYSADVYCSKYDETTGICPDGDDCPYIHRNTGDTERRYHLRYYKTGTCIHETDSKGHCVKNGPHCAFAHGAHDLRPPVYDIREQQTQDDAGDFSPCIMAEQLTQETIDLSEKIVNEDPKWQDANYVLANYKTEVCKRPPRLCRQGYACPQYHNMKDRRRNPMQFNYRSSPCPIVKQGDDWKDPTCCDKGDDCQFCHTRTEQQFHPEIYKSTKCHDMTQTGYCPRGLFCAFAHVEQEIRIVRDPVTNSSEALVETFHQLNTGSDIAAVEELPDHKIGTGNSIGNLIKVPQSAQNRSANSNLVWNNFSSSFGQDIPNHPQNLSNPSLSLESRISKSLPSGPSYLSQPMAGSLGSNAKSFGLNSSYSKAPGCERTAPPEQPNLLNNQGFGSIGNNAAWPMSMSGNPFGSFSSTSSSSSNLLHRHFNALNSEAAPFYPPDETVNSVVGNALKDVDEQKNQEKHESSRNLSSRIWSNQTSTSDSNLESSSLFQMSDPVNIPQEQMLSENFQRRVQGGFPSMSPPVFGSLDFPNSSISGAKYLSLQRSSPLDQTGLSSSLGSGMMGAAEYERMQQKCKQWEESWNQAKAACDAWKREATDANERARLSEERGRMAAERYQLLENKLSTIDCGGEGNKNCPFLHQQYDVNSLRTLPVASLKQLQTNYKADLETVEKLIWEMLWKSQQTQ